MVSPIIRRLADEELGLLLPVFTHAFGHPIGLDVLRWKYTTGWGESWLAEMPNGASTLHCGLIFRDVLFDQKRVRMAQFVDLAAGAGKTGLVRSSGSFNCLMRYIFGNLSCLDNPLGLAFGFPSARAMRLIEHLGISFAVDQLYDLCFISAVHRNWLGLRCELTEVLPEARVVDLLWQSMARELADAAVGVRDAAYLHWRFVQHPHRSSYRLLLCQSAIWRKPCALLVLRWGDEGVCHLIDVLGPPSALPDVLVALQTWCAQRGLHEIRLNMTSRFALQLAPLSAACTASEIQIAFRSDTPEDIQVNFKNNWWLTAGDTDYR